MGDLVGLHSDDPQGSHLCTVEFYRRPDGSVRSRLVSMDGSLIETTGEDVSSRMLMISRWMLEGAGDMARQAGGFDDTESLTEQDRNT